jgi:hypothetical protein
MRSAYQRPLAATCFKSSPHKFVNPASIFNLPKHRLNRLAWQLIQLAATLGQKLSLHHSVAEKSSDIGSSGGG